MQQVNCFKQPLVNTECLSPSRPACVFIVLIKKNYPRSKHLRHKTSLANAIVTENTSKMQFFSLPFGANLFFFFFYFVCLCPGCFTFPFGSRRGMMKNHSDRRFQNVDTLWCLGPTLWTWWRDYRSLYPPAIRKLFALLLERTHNTQ